MRYLQKIKHYMLVYRRADHLDEVGYIDADFVSCLNDEKSTSRYVFMLVGETIS